MSRRIFFLLPPLAALGLALCLLLPLVVSAPGALAEASRVRASSGSVTGVVIKPLDQNATVAGLSVTLQAVDGSIAKDVATATSDNQGRFAFSGLDTSGLTTYAVYTHYEGGVFETSAISFDSGASQQTSLPVYDTSSSDAGVRVASTTLLFSPPDQAKGLLSVGVLMTVENSSNSAYLASLGPANGLPTNLLRFSLPSGAQDVTLGAGFSGLQVVSVATGFGVAATVPPGQSAYAFAYKVAYTGTSYPFSFKAEYPSQNVVALLPPALSTRSSDFVSKPEVQANGSTYKVLAVGTIASGQTASFSLTSLQLPGENPDIDFVQLLLVGIFLLLLLIGLSVLFLRRGALAVALGWVPASALSPARVRSRRQAARDAERRRLLQALLALEEKRAAGSIGPMTYDRRRFEIREQLAPLLLPAGSDT